MKLSLLALAIAKFSTVGTLPSAAPEASNFIPVAVSALECQVELHPTVTSLSYFPKIDEIAFFSSSGAEVGSYWDTFSYFRDSNTKRIIVGNFTPGKESAEKADAVIDADGSGSIRLEAGFTSRLVNCTIKFR